MKAKRPALLIIVALFISVCIFAQEPPATGTTIEELFLQNIEIRLIKEQAFTVDRDMKLLALENIENMISEERVTSGDPEIHYILDELAGEGVYKIVKENKRTVNYFPDVRRRSCELLGKLGGENSMNTLIQVLAVEEAPEVLAEAAYALGLIGMNENNEVTTAISYALLHQDIINPDNNFAFASLLAFEKIAAKTDGVNDPEVFRALIRIAQGNYIPDVKLKAHQVMKLLGDF